MSHIEKMWKMRQNANHNANIARLRLLSLTEEKFDHIGPHLQPNFDESNRTIDDLDASALPYQPYRCLFYQRSRNHETRARIVFGLSWGLIAIDGKR